MRRYRMVVVGLIAAASFILGRGVVDVPMLIRTADADQTFGYSGGSYDTGRLSDELLAAGITPLTIRGNGGPGVPSTEIEIVVADSVQESAVAAVVNAHTTNTYKALDLVLVRRTADNSGFEIGRLGGPWNTWDPGFVQSTRKGSDQTNSTNTLSDCTGLDFALKANTVYDFNFTIYFNTAANTTGLTLSMDGPSNPVAVRFGAMIAESTTSYRNGSGASYNAELVGQSSAGSTSLVATISGTIQTNSSGGTLKVRFRSEVNGSAVTILRGSHGELKS